MPKERAKLFTHGGSQAVRLPKAFRFGGKEVSIRRDGDRVILEPIGHDPETFWARIDALADGDPPEAQPLIAPGLLADRAASNQDARR